MKNKNFFAAKQVVNFQITLPLAKLDMISSRLVSNGLICSDDILVNIQLVTCLLLSNITELSIGVKLKNFDNYHHLKNAFCLTKNHILFLIFV